MSRKVAFVTGASRGIGAESAVALASAGYDVAITARTLSEGERHDHVGSSDPLPGSLEATAAAVMASGGQALCLRADILDEASMIAAARDAMDHFGAVDLLFNNAVYQGTGNQESLMQVTREQLERIYQGNVFTPLALVRAILPRMLEAGRGTVLNMVSYTAFHDPPAPADRGGWGFAYPSSKAAFARMAGSLRVEHAGSGVRFLNMEPGTVVTEVMKAAGITEAVMKRFKPCTPQAIAAVVAWLADNDPPSEVEREGVIAGPALAKALDFLGLPSLLGA
jgi:NAD(P)-dependent dehydrogenase (short-subunit alcohol dehydrogenase family)